MMLTETKPSFKIKHLAAALGASMEDIDLAQPIDAHTMAELRQAFLDHLALVFPDQGHLTSQQHIAFAARWGKLQVMPKRSG